MQCTVLLLLLMVANTLHPIGIQIAMKRALKRFAFSGVCTASVHKDSFSFVI